MNTPLQYIRQHGEDMQETRNWTWGTKKKVESRGAPRIKRFRRFI